MNQPSFISCKKSNKMKSTLLHIIILVFAFTFTASLTASAQNSDGQDKTVLPTQKLQTIKLKVGGITCAGDCKDIQKVINKLNGVASCKQIGKPAATSVFEVSFDPAVITENEIRSKVEDVPGCDNPNERPYRVKQG